MSGNVWVMTFMLLSGSMPPYVVSMSLFPSHTLFDGVFEKERRLAAAGAVPVAMQTKVSAGMATDPRTIC